MEALLVFNELQRIQETSQLARECDLAGELEHLTSGQWLH